MLHLWFGTCTAEDAAALSPDCTGSLTQTTTYLNDTGATTEKVVAGASTTWNDYLVADGHMVGEHIDNGSSPLFQYFVLDHLGSVAVVTNSSGALQTNGRLSYDAWGNRRLSNGQDGTPGASPTTRGFTGAEEIDAVGLVNLNGRVYDPYLGRMMSADPETSSVYVMQLLNRYSYVGNNPLSYRKFQMPFLKLRRTLNGAREVSVWVEGVQKSKFTDT